MTTAYALAVALGLRGPAALALHLAALVAVTAAALRRPGDAATLGLALLWSTFVSPYAYDYDFAMSVVAAVALSGPLLAAVGARASVTLLTALLASECLGLTWWVAGGRGGPSAALLVPLGLAVPAVLMRARP